MRDTEPFSRFIEIIIANDIDYYTFAHLFIEDSYFFDLLLIFSFQAANAKGMNININTKINALDTYVTCQLASSIAPRN